MPASRSLSPQMLYLIFHGPWGFAVDSDTNSITALTPACSGHVYLLGESPAYGPMPAGNYAFSDEGAVQGVSNWFANQPVQTEIATMPPRLTLPRPEHDARVHCALTLPGTDCVGFYCAPRKANAQSLDGDRLLSGRHFSLLNTNGDLALVQVLPYQIIDSRRLSILGDTGGLWAPYPAAQGPFKVHVYAQSLDASAEDHFSMMASLFNLDLHLDGPDIIKNLAPIVPPGVKDIVASDLSIGDEMLVGWGRRTGHVPGHSRTLPYPIVCGGNILIRYSSKMLLAPAAGASQMTRMDQ